MPFWVNGFSLIMRLIVGRGSVFFIRQTDNIRSSYIAMGTGQVYTLLLSFILVNFILLFLFMEFTLCIVTAFSMLFYT